MTETLNTTTSCSEAPELSGVDLARVALHQAREAAKARGEGSTRKTKRRTRTTTVRGDGREPTGFAAVLQGLMADRAWDVPAAGGSILDQWPAIAADLSPKLAAHVTAIAFHAETGQLDLRPDSPAYATQLRLLAARIITVANEVAGAQTVRTVRVLAAGPTTLPAPRTTAPAPGPAVPARTRDMAPAGFHRALTAHQAVPRTRKMPPDIAQAAPRQAHVPRDLSRRACPEPEATRDDQPALIDAALAQRRRDAEAVRLRALHRARAERAGLAQLPAQVHQATRQLDRLG
ncbi:DciA family protein [Streptomyces hypolithicus]